MGKWANPLILHAAFDKIEVASYVAISSNLYEGGKRKVFRKLNADCLAIGPLDKSQPFRRVEKGSSLVMIIPGVEKLPVTKSGWAYYTYLLDPVEQTILYRTTCPAVSLKKGMTLNISSWEIEIGKAF